MKDNSVYLQYSYWSDQNKTLLYQLNSGNSQIFNRYGHIIEVLDYLYQLKINDENYADDEEVIFITGFNYLASMFADIKQILSKYFHDDIKHFITHESQLHLVFDAIEMQNELLRLSDPQATDIDMLNNFEIKVLNKISSHQPVADADFTELDLLSNKIFAKYDVEYNSIPSIFHNIYETLNLGYNS